MLDARLRLDRRLRRTLPALGLAALSSVAWTQSTDGWRRSPTIWEEARRPGARSIKGYEEEARRNPPPEEALLFAGSATIWMWDLAKWFPELRTINRGFGGSMISESTYFADRIILPHKPSTIVMYAGDNDIWLGKSPELTAEHFQAFVDKTHAALPRTRIIFISIRPSIARWNVVEKFREANRLIRQFIETDPRLFYVDIDDAMLGPDGKPRPELFIEDQLHLTDEGYRIWTERLRPVLEKAEADYRAAKAGEAK